MEIHVRPFHAADADDLVDILTRNGQFGHPDVEGATAMRRVAACEAAVFLVAEGEGRPQGFVRAIYDGSRALIHLLSVSPEAQHRGIGRTLVDAAQTELRRRGAPTVSVLVNDASAAFWQKQGFHALPVYLMLKTT
ncbi:MAG TPA: GNAT family N-acetyltransferase [Vicinamibacterales bacterium]|nr:GNAT family N-acetyltransferase [Vicinamibacterales bacterium]